MCSVAVARALVRSADERLRHAQRALVSMGSRRGGLTGLQYPDLTSRHVARQGSCCRTATSVVVLAGLPSEFGAAAMARRVQRGPPFVEL